MPSKQKKDRAGKAAAEYDAHLTKAEDRLEASAHRAEDSFYEHTSGAEAKLDQAEDKLEAAARKVDNR